jgi:hypothetical protein
VGVQTEHLWLGSVLAGLDIVTDPVVVLLPIEHFHVPDPFLCVSLSSLDLFSALSLLATGLCRQDSGHTTSTSEWTATNHPILVSVSAEGIPPSSPPSPRALQRLTNGAAGSGSAALDSTPGSGPGRRRGVNRTRTLPIRGCPGITRPPSPPPFFSGRRYVSFFFVLDGVDECAMATWREWAQHLLGRVVQDQQREGQMRGGTRRRGEVARARGASGAACSSVCICRSCARPGQPVSGQNTGTPYLVKISSDLTLSRSNPDPVRQSLRPHQARDWRHFCSWLRPTCSSRTISLPLPSKCLFQPRLLPSSPAPTTPPLRQQAQGHHPDSTVSPPSRCGRLGARSQDPS